MTNKEKFLAGKKFKFFFEVYSLDQEIPCLCDNYGRHYSSVPLEKVTNNGFKVIKWVMDRRVVVNVKFSDCQFLEEEETV